MKIGRMGVVVGGGRARVGKNRNKSRKLKLHGRAEWSGVVAAEMARRVIDVPNRAKCFSTRHLATPVLVSSNWPGFHRISYWKTRVHAFRQLSKPTLRPDSRRASYEGLARIRLVAADSKRGHDKMSDLVPWIKLEIDNVTNAVPSRSVRVYTYERRALGI